MAENPDRFVIIDGVQVSRERAKRKGLIDADGNPVQTGPAESRARTQTSARRPGSGGARASAAPVVTAQVGDGAVSTGEDAQRAGAAAPANSEGTDDAATSAGDAADSSSSDDAGSDDAGSDDGASDDASSTAAAKAPKINRR